MSGGDIARAARFLVARYGAGAPDCATGRIEDLLDAGNAAGDRGTMH